METIFLQHFGGTNNGTNPAGGQGGNQTRDLLISTPEP